jgi:tetratricopeptide (TPR) repeat protein
MVDSAATRPAPSASGTLAKTPLANLLLYVLDKKLSGTLELMAPDRRVATVVIVAGQPAKVRTSEPVAYLGRVLHELGFLTEEQLTRSLADLAKQKAVGPRLHGEILMGQGLVDEAKVTRALGEQVARKLRYAAGLPPETGYAYFDGYQALATWGGPAGVGIDPYTILWSMLREHPPGDQVEVALQKIGGSALRVRGLEVSRLGLTGDERRVVELMREHSLTVDEMARAGQLDERTARLLAYLLLATKQVEVLPVERRTSNPPPPGKIARPPTPFAAMRPPAAPSGTMKPATPMAGIDPSASMAAARSSNPMQAARPSAPVEAARISTLPAERNSSGPARNRSSSPPGTGRVSLAPPTPGLSPELTERWKDINERAATIDRADYFGMLDVARDATTQEIESAYFALAKLWHPDRLPNDLAPARDACSRVFARMSEARATLVDPKQRERYMKLLADGSGSPEAQETVMRVVDASTAFQKAEVCFKRNDATQAEEFCRRAVELDDSQADYQALLAWLLALKPENQGGDATMTSIRMLDKAIKMNERCEKGYFFRGMLYKRLGKGELATRDFKQASELNPRNIDAVREVRLHTMRGGSSERERDSSPPPPKAGDKGGGLFGRLFKK